MSTVLITGGNKGIGFATAKYFLEKGYNVIISGRNEERLQTAVRKLGEEKCRYVLWDAANVSDIVPAIEKANSYFGPIHVFVNNAGIVSDDDWTKGFFYRSEKDWNDTININLRGVYFAVQKEAQYMVEKGIHGHIVNVCSEMGFRPAENAYGISKWGVRGLTMGLGRMLARYEITLNGIAPGETATEIIRQKEGEVKKLNSPRGQQATPEEIAEAIFFLANSKNIIGEILVSDGGRRLM